MPRVSLDTQEAPVRQLLHSCSLRRRLPRLQPLPRCCTQWLSALTQLKTHLLQLFLCADGCLAARPRLVHIICSQLTPVSQTLHSLVHALPAAQTSFLHQPCTSQVKHLRS